MNRHSRFGAEQEPMRSGREAPRGGSRLRRAAAELRFVLPDPELALGFAEARDDARLERELHALVVVRRKLRPREVAAAVRVARRREARPITFHQLADGRL